MQRFNDDDRPFPIRKYTKAELAMQYYPDESITNAITNLARWVRLNKPLVQELQKVGYNKYRRCYTPREVALIIHYLGEPGC